MSNPNRCERCGGPLPQAGPLGAACPRCMMQMGVEPASENLEDPDSTLAASQEAPKDPAISARPTVIGRYRILRLIGEGGMGVVYEAEQDHPRRIVALKIIKPGIASPELLHRFEQESHALGRLQHPGIAQIYEAGTADTGFGPQPYFAMELIRGKTLTDYAEEQHLNTRQRLEMVSKIAEAVQHAHQRGLIHRDLKPVNIMVDETGQPKILDFGVARATDSDSHATSQTGMGQLVGTLAYMSPEQVLADPLELDTRSDVYALGVILYELLAGRLPYTIRKKLHETIHAIREEDPARLSSINRAYRGDIETIAAKALEKDKTRRYGSSAELAADIQRYLHDEPIVARPASTTYQLRKFARRHKALVAGVAAVFVVLAGGVVTSTWEAMRANRERVRAVQAEVKTGVERDHAKAAEQTATTERDKARNAEDRSTIERDRAVAEEQRANTEAATATALYNSLVKGLFVMANPLAQEADQPAAIPNPNLSVKEALDRFAPRIGDQFQKQPLLEAKLRETIAGIYSGLDDLDEAKTQLELALALRGRDQGEGHPDTLNAMSLLASVELTRGQLAVGTSLWEQVVEGDRRSLGDESPVTRAAVSALVRAYKQMYRWAPAEALLAPLVRDERRKLGDSHPATLEYVRLLVDLYLTPRGNQAGTRSFQAKAEALLKGFIGDQPRNPGKETLATRTCVNLLAGLYMTQNKNEEAESLLRPFVPEDLVTKLQAGGRGVLEEHPTALESMDLLEKAYRKEGKVAQAAALHENSLKVTQAAFGAGMPAVPGKENAATPLMQQAVKVQELVRLGKDSEAEELVKKVVEGFRRVVAARDTTTAMIGNILIAVAQEYGSKGKDERADRLLQDVLDIHRGALGESDPNTVSVMAAVAKAYESFRNYESAEKVLADRWNIQRKRLGETHLDSRESLNQLASAYLDDARFAQAQGKAERAQDKYANTVELVTQLLKLSLRASSGQEQEDSRKVRIFLATVHESQGKLREAAEEFSNLLNIWPHRNFNDESQVRIIGTSLGLVRVHQGKYAEAEAGLRDYQEFFDATRPQNMTYFNWQGVLGASLIGQGKYPEAESRLKVSYEGRARLQARPNWGQNPPVQGMRGLPLTLKESGDWIVRLYDEWGKPEEAAEWRIKVQADKAGAPAPRP